MSPELAQIAEAQVENPIVDLGTLETFVPQAKTVFRWPTIAALGTLALANINTEVAYAASADIFIGPEAMPVVCGPIFGATAIWAIAIVIVKV